MKKKTNLESGFLFLYDWMPVLELLPAKEVKALLLALIARQRENKPLPSFRNPTTDSFARMIEPVICRRLEGAMWAKKGAEAESDPEGEPMGVPDGEPTDPREVKSRKEKKSELNSAEEKRKSAPAPPAEGVAPLRPLSEEEKGLLISEGMPAAYIEARAERAALFAARSGRDILTLLSEWWKGDMAAYRARERAHTAERGHQSSFDVEDFWNAALARTYDEDSTLKKPLSPETG